MEIFLSQVRIYLDEKCHVVEPGSVTKNENLCSREDDFHVSL
jgi:hypothetical protein